MAQTKLSGRSARVVLVEPALSLRQAIAEPLRAAGFTSVTPVATLGEAWALLETGSVDWLITSLFPRSAINALHVLQACTREARLFSVRVSLILGADELYALPSAFELGVMSWHPRIASADQARAALESLLALVTRHRGDDCRIAADYLWEWLAAQARARELVELQSALASLYRGDPEVLMRLAEAHLRSGSTGPAAAILHGLRLLDAGVGESAAAMYERFAGSPLASMPDEASPEGVGLLGIRSALVIDPDEASRRAVSAVLRALGAVDIHELSDGRSAFEWLRRQEVTPDVAVMEWVLPELTSVALLQRLSQTAHATLPILVLSDRLGIGDLAGLYELGVADLLAKPATSDDLIRAMIAVVREEARPRRYQAVRRRMVAALRRGARAEAATLLESYVVEPSAGMGARLLLDAEASFLEGAYGAAREAATAALAHGCDSLAALSIIGKSLMKTKDYKAATAFLEKANELAPRHVERLCLLAEARAVQGDTAAARAAVDAAATVDPRHPRVLETSGGILLMEGDEEGAATCLAGLEAYDDLVSFLNNRAVALAVTGRTDDSINLYARALRAIDDGRSATRAVLRFNLALAHLRSDDSAAALVELEAAASDAEGSLRQKSEALRARIADALGAGRQVRLAPPDEARADAQAAPPGAADLGAQLLLRRGDLGCFRLYAARSTDAALAAPLLEGAPPFHWRVPVGGGS